MNGLQKDIFKYSALGVALIMTIYLGYRIISNHLLHQTEVLIKIDQKSNQQIELLKDIRNSLNAKR